MSETRAAAHGRTRFPTSATWVASITAATLATPFWTLMPSANVPTWGTNVEKITVGNLLSMHSGMPQETEILAPGLGYAQPYWPGMATWCAQTATDRAAIEIVA